jgi:hypothetical protein
MSNARAQGAACRREQHTSAYVSIRQHTSAYVSIRQHTSAYVSIRQQRVVCGHTHTHTHTQTHTHTHTHTHKHTHTHTHTHKHTHTKGHRTSTELLTVPLACGGVTLWEGGEGGGNGPAVGSFSEKSDTYADVC